MNSFILDSGVCVYFCEIELWGHWLNRYYNNQSIKIARLTHSNMKIGDVLKNVEEGYKLCIVVDER